MGSGNRPNIALIVGGPSDPVQKKSFPGNNTSSPPRRTDSGLLNKRRSGTNPATLEGDMAYVVHPDCAQQRPGPKPRQPCPLQNGYAFASSAQQRPESKPATPDALMSAEAWEDAQQRPESKPRQPP